MNKIIPDKDLEKFIKATGWKPNEKDLKHKKGKIDIPTLAMFYGIIIYMYYFDNKEHKLPHIHANYGEYDAVISIPNGDVLKGEMPYKN